MVDKIFSGKVSAQEALGETVTITVTLPDLTTDVLTAVTDVDGNYTVTKGYTEGGDYTAVASVAASKKYLAATSAVASFTILLEREVTLNVA